MRTVRFGIRDLLWATVVVVLSLLWWIDHTALRQAADFANVRASAAFTQARRFQLMYFQAKRRPGQNAPSQRP
jgi:hypothetical protein